MQIMKSMGKSDSVPCMSGSASSCSNHLSLCFRHELRFASSKICECSKGQGGSEWCGSKEGWTHALRVIDLWQRSVAPGGARRDHASAPHVLAGGAAARPPGRWSSAADDQQR